MQLKISSFNKTLFRKNLSRSWPLWAMATFGMSLFPLVMFTELARGYWSANWNGLEMTQVYYNAVNFALPIISLFYAIMCALATWHYLCNPRFVGLMHTLPITRRGLFLTNFLSGMAMMAIPYVVAGALCVLLSICYGFFEPVGLLVTILCVIAESFFYFATATAVCFVSANVFAISALYFIFHFLAVIADCMLSTFAQGFLFGLNRSYNGAVEWLSPTVYLIENIQVTSESRQVPSPDSYGGISYELASVTLENWHLIALYALAGVALVAVSYLLYQRRRSECAGDVVAVGWMKPVFRWGVTACAAIMGGQGLYLLFLQDNQYTVAPMVVCMVVFGAIGYYAARMLLAKNLRVFKGSWRGLAALAVLSAALCLGLESDLFGIESRVPAVSEIDNVSLYTCGNHYALYPDEDGKTIENLRQLHEAVVSDADYIQNFHKNRGETYPDDYGNYYSTESVEITYILKNGTEIQRWYRLPITRERMNTPGTYDDLLNQFINSFDMKTRRLYSGEADYDLISGHLYPHSSERTEFSTHHAKTIHAAVYQDLLEGNWGTYHFFSWSDQHYLDMTLSFEFSKMQTDENGTSFTRYDYINVDVHRAMRHTLAALQELGLITAEDLYTLEELYPERYASNYQIWDEGYAEKYYEEHGFYPLPAEELISFPQDAYVSSDSSIGIIGGADGPTSIIVAGGF